MAVRDKQRAIRGLAKIPSDLLATELHRRQKAASQLEAKRAKLLSTIADLDREISKSGVALNGSALVLRGHRGPGRPPGKRATTLPKALAALLKGKTMSVTDMSEAVQKAGYPTDSPNFRTAVNAVLLKHTNLFRRVGWGQYTAK